MKKIFLLAVVMLILNLPTVTKAAANWIWVYSDDYFSIWIDNNSVGRDSNGFFAYFKWTYSNAGRNKIIEHRRSHNESISGFYNLHNCVRFKYFKNYGGIKYSSLMEYIFYDKNGNILDSLSVNFFYWDRVTPDTYAEAEYDAAFARVRGK